MFQLNTNFNTVIYDLDGTLVDSAPVVSFVLNKLRVRLGLPALPQSSFINWISLGGKDLVVNALNISAEDSDVYLSEFRAIYLLQKVPLSSVYPNVFSTLNGLKNRGIRLGICTNKPRNLVDRVLNETALGGLFDHVLAGDDLLTKKPNVANLNLCLKAMDTRPDATIFVGDSTVDQEAARNSNIPFAFFSHGYNDGVKKNEASYVFHDHAHFLQSLFQ